jgi:ABC-2 type transport system ATP-binding protein
MRRQQDRHACRRAELINAAPDAPARDRIEPEGRLGRRRTSRTSSSWAAGSDNSSIGRPVWRRPLRRTAAMTRGSSSAACWRSRTRLAGTYSGGMVRRLELAQALVNRPALLVH